MERSRDGYRGRYRDPHPGGSTNRNHYEERSARENYRERPSNGTHYPPRNSPDGTYHYRSSRTSLSSRPVSSRNGPSTHFRHQHSTDDYPASHRSSSGNKDHSNYSDNRRSSSSNHRDIYPPSLFSEEPILSSTSMYYPTSQSIANLRDRGLPLPSSSYSESERHRYHPSTSSHRRASPSSSTYRNERTMDYPSRNTNHDVYMRGEYRPLSPPSLAPLSVRSGEPYGETYRTNDYGHRAERYAIASNRTNTSNNRDYPLVSISTSPSSSTYRPDLYRSSSNVSMSSPPPAYLTRDQYAQDMTYRPMSQSRDYDISSSRPSNMNEQDRHDYHSSSRNRPNLKRPSTRYDDHESIPSKRAMRR